MSFTHVMPVADLGLPRGYKNSKTAWKQALKIEKEKTIKKKRKSVNSYLNIYSYDRGLLTRHKKDAHAKDRFENYFNQRQQSRPATRQRTTLNQATSQRNLSRGFEPNSTSSLDIRVNSDDIISGIRFGMRDMISRLERSDN